MGFDGEKLKRDKVRQYREKRNKEIREKIFSPKVNYVYENRYIIIAIIVSLFIIIGFVSYYLFSTRELPENAVKMLTGRCGPIFAPHECIIIVHNDNKNWHIKSVIIDIFSKNHDEFSKYKIDISVDPLSSETKYFTCSYNAKTFGDWKIESAKGSLR